MSVATESPPLVRIPERARPRTATVLPFPAGGPTRAGDACGPTLRQAAGAIALQYPVRPLPRRRRAVAVPARSAVTGRPVRPSVQQLPVRLTRRGYAVLGVLVAGLTAGLLWFAHASATAASPPDRGRVPAVVTVRQGDTLWSIATRVAPQRDPRVVVDELEQRNGLSSAVVYPGQRLRTR